MAHSPVAPQPPPPAPDSIPAKRRKRCDGVRKKPAKPQRSATSKQQSRPMPLEDQFSRLMDSAGATEEPLQGMLRAATADVLRMSHRVQQTLDAELQESGSLATIEVVAPTIDLLMRLYRQADRLASLEGRLTFSGAGCEQRCAA